GAQQGSQCNCRDSRSKGSPLGGSLVRCSWRSPCTDYSLNTWMSQVNYCLKLRGTLPCNFAAVKRRARSLSCQFRKYVRYSVSLCAGLNPASRMMRRSSSSVVQLVTPAARTTFSSSITEPTSLPPKRRPIWQTFNPWVTQLDCTLRKFERHSRAMARTFKYSTAVASSQ